MKNLIMAILLATTLSLSATNNPTLEKYGLKKGTPNIESFNEMTFGPDGILFIADSKGGKIFAIDTQDNKESDVLIAFKVENFESKVSERLGIDKDDIMVHDMVVNPISKNIYLSISLKRQEWVNAQNGKKLPNALAYSDMLLKVDINTKEISEVKLNDVVFSEYSIEDGPSREELRERLMSMMDMKFRDNKLLLAGMSGESFEATLKTIDFPFSNTSKTTNLEIFHYSRNRYQTRAPIEVFDTYLEDGDTKLLAVFYCSPLVTFNLDDFKDGNQVRSETISELGAGSTYPLDMIMYEYEGAEYALIAISSRGLAAFKLDDIKAFNEDLKARREHRDRSERFTTEVGVKFQLFPGEVQQIDNYSDEHFMALQRRVNGNLDLHLRHKSLSVFGNAVGIKSYIENVIKYKGLESGIKELKSIIKNGNTDYNINERDLNGLGYSIIASSNLDAALEVFKAYVQAYPESANAHDSLGETYMKIGDSKNAIINYEKSLELNPANNNAKEMLKTLKE